MLLVVDVMLCFLSYVIALIFPSLSFLTKSKLYFMNHYCILPAILPTICVHSWQVNKLTISLALLSLKTYKDDFVLQSLETTRIPSPNKKWKTHCKYFIGDMFILKTISQPIVPQLHVNTKVLPLKVVVMQCAKFLVINYIFFLSLLFINLLKSDRNQKIISHVNIPLP